MPGTMDFGTDFPKRTWEDYDKEMQVARMVFGDDGLLADVYDVFQTKWAINYGYPPERWRPELYEPLVACKSAEEVKEVLGRP